MKIKKNERENKGQERESACLKNIIAFLEFPWEMGTPESRVEVCVRACRKNANIQRKSALKQELLADINVVYLRVCVEECSNMLSS